MRASMRVTFYNRYSRFWRGNVPTLFNRKHHITERLPELTNPTFINYIFYIKLNSEQICEDWGAFRYSLNRATCGI